MAQPNDTFYVTGGTMHPDAASYVERRADRELYEGLRSGEFCYVLHARQMGKSSMMVRTAERLRAEGIRVAQLDLTQIGKNVTPEQWYDGLLLKLGEQLHLEDELDDAWNERRNLGPLLRFFGAIEHVVLPALERQNESLVVSIDEIDFCRSLPFSADELFAAIRDCYNRRSADARYQRLTFCLLGVATPAELIHDPRTTPFNIGRRIELTDFTEEEALPLGRGFSGKPGGWRDAVVRRVLHWTGGHPYLTQRLCRQLAESQPDGPITTRAVDAVCAELFLSSRARERDDNLTTVRDRLLRSEADLAAVLDLYRQVWSHPGRVQDDEADARIAVLRLSGVAGAQKGRLRVRNRIYATVFDRAWITASMPDAERKRQRAAYRRGAARTAAIATALVLAFAAVAGQALRNEANWRRSEANARHSELKALTQKSEVNRIARRLDDKNRELWHALHQTTAERERAIDARANELAQRQNAQRQERLARNAASKARVAELVARLGKDRADRAAYIAAMSLIPREWDAGEGDRVKDLLAATSTSPHRSFEWHYWNARSNRYLAAWKGTSAEFSSDGNLILSLPDPAAAQPSNDSGIQIRDANTGRLLRKLSGRAGSVYSARFSSDDRLIIGWGNDRTVRIFETATAKVLRTIDYEAGDIRGAILSPNGMQALTHVIDPNVPGMYRVRLHSVDGKVLLDTRGLRASFSPAGQYVLVTTQSEFPYETHLVDSRTGQRLRTLDGTYHHFSSDDKFLGSVSRDSASLWALPRCEQLVARVERSAVWAAFTHKDAWLVGTDAGIVKRFYDKGYDEVREFRVETTTPDDADGRQTNWQGTTVGAFLLVQPTSIPVSGDPESVRSHLYVPETGEKIRSFQGSRMPVVDVSVGSSSGASTAVTRGSRGGLFNESSAPEVLLWGVDRRPVVVPGAQVYHATMSPTSTRLLTQEAGQVKLWEPSTLTDQSVIGRGTPIMPRDGRLWLSQLPSTSTIRGQEGVLRLVPVPGLHPAEHVSIGAAPHIYNLVAISESSWRGRTGVWDLRTGRALFTVPITGATFANSSALMVGKTSMGHVAVYKILMGRPVSRSVIVFPAKQVVFGPSDDVLIAVSERNLVSIQRPSGRWIRRWPLSPGVSCVFSRDASRVAIQDSENNEVTVVDLRNMQRVSRLPKAGKVLAFTPDNRRILVDRGWGFSLLDVVTGQSLLTAQTAQGPVGNADFSADGTRLVTTHMFGCVLLDGRPGGLGRSSAWPIQRFMWPREQHAVADGSELSLATPEGGPDLDNQPTLTVLPGAANLQLAGSGWILEGGRLVHRTEAEGIVFIGGLSAAEFDFTVEMEATRDAVLAGFLPGTAMSAGSDYVFFTGGYFNKRTQLRLFGVELGRSEQGMTPGRHLMRFVRQAGRVRGYMDGQLLLDEVDPKPEVLVDRLAVIGGYGGNQVIHRLTLRSTRSAARQGPSDAFDKRITMNLRETPLRYAVDLLFAGTGELYSVDAQVPNIPVTLSMRDVTLRQAVRAIVSAAATHIPGLTYSLEKGVYRIRVRPGRSGVPQ